MSTPSGYKQYSVPNMSPQQIGLLNQLLGGLSEYGPQALGQLNKFAMGDDDSYDQMFAPAMNQFNQQTIPGLAARFAGHGTLNSSAFQNAAAGAAGNLASDLGSQRAALQRKALKSLLGLQNEFLNMQPYQYGLRQKRTGWDTAKDIIDMGTSVAGTVAAFL